MSGALFKLPFFHYLLIILFTYDFRMAVDEDMRLIMDGMDPEELEMNR